jgi:hypothetical protein
LYITKVAKGPETTLAFGGNYFSALASFIERLNGNPK